MCVCVCGRRPDVPSGRLIRQHHHRVAAQRDTQRQAALHAAAELRCLHVELVAVQVHLLSRLLHANTRRVAVDATQAAYHKQHAHTSWEVSRHASTTRTQKRRGHAPDVEQQVLGNGQVCMQPGPTVSR